MLPTSQLKRSGDKRKAESVFELGTYALLCSSGPVYTETFSLVSVMFWLRLHLPFTRKRFGKRIFSKTVSKVDRFKNGAVS